MSWLRERARRARRLIVPAILSTISGLIAFIVSLIVFRLLDVHGAALFAAWLGGESSGRSYERLTRCA